MRVKRDRELRRTSPRLADHCGRKGIGYEMKTGQCVWTQCESVLRDGKTQREAEAKPTQRCCCPVAQSCLIHCDLMDAAHQAS